MISRLIGVLSLVSATVGWLGDSAAREWTDRTGKFSIEAEFVGLADGRVKLKRADGKAIELPINRLSEADRRYIEQLADAPEPAADGPSTDGSSTDGPSTDTRQVLTLQHAGPVHAVAFSPDGKQLLTASGPSAVTLWNAETGKQVRSFTGHAEPVRAIAFSPDGKWVLTGSADRTAALWDAATGKKQRSLAGHADKVNSVDFSPDGKRVLTGSDDKTAVIWDAATGQKLQVFSEHPVKVVSVAFGPDGRKVLTGAGDQGKILAAVIARQQGDNRVIKAGEVNLWDAGSGEKIRALHDAYLPILAVDYSLDGRMVMRSSMGETVVWDVATGKKLRTFDEGSAWARSLAFSPDGRHVLTGPGKKAALWDVASGQNLLSFDGHSETVHCVAFSPDGRRIVTGSADKTAVVWTVGAGPVLQPEGRQPFRTWTATSGGKIDAALVGTDILALRLKTRSGKIISAPYGRLSRADRAHVAEVMGAFVAADDEPEEMYYTLEAIGQVMHVVIHNTGEGNCAVPLNDPGLSGKPGDQFRSYKGGEATGFSVRATWKDHSVSVFVDAPTSPGPFFRTRTFDERVRLVEFASRRVWPYEDVNLNEDKPKPAGRKPRANEPAPRNEPQPGNEQKEAAMLLVRAKRLIRRNPEAAMQFLQQILDDYPDSKAAETAEALLLQF